MLDGVMHLAGIVAFVLIMKFFFPDAWGHVRDAAKAAFDLR
jgi:hypothetical protein